MFMSTELAGKHSAKNGTTAKPSTISTISPPPPRLEIEAAVYPPDSLLGRYLIYACQRLESADSYIVGSVLPVMAACLARRIWFRWGDEKIYPNIYSILGGKSGERKSSAVNLAETLAQAALPPASFLPPACSSESLFDEYDPDCGGLPDKLLLLDDANPLLGSWTGSSYGQRVAQQFLRLYDCKGISETFQKNKKDGNISGRRHVDETSTSIVLGATFDVCRLQGRGISSGLQRRFLVYAAEKHGRFIACPPAPDPAGLEYLKQQFGKLCKMQAECKFAKDALGVWEAYQRRNRDLLHQTDKEAISARLNGAPRSVQKIAMLFEAACWVDGKKQWDGTIRAATLDLAIKHVDHCLATASKLDTFADREATAISAESLLARIRQDFRGRQKHGWIALTKTDLTAKYAPHPERANTWKPTDLYERFIPALMDKGQARLGGRDGKKVCYEFACEDVSHLSGLSSLSASEHSEAKGQQALPEHLRRLLETTKLFLQSRGSGS